jgi:RHS repeat-associated protein
LSELQHFENDARSEPCTRTKYIYDADGQRVSKIFGSYETDYVHDRGGALLATYVNGSYFGNFQDMWIGGKHFGEVVVAAGNASQTQNFSLTNWVGSQAAYTNPSTGIPTAAYLSQPFGDAQTTLFGSNNDDIHFTGKERDGESGNDYFGARYYASSMGRWMSPDTDFNLKRILPNPQRWNRYAYVINNPLVLVDPDGLTDIYVFRPEAKTNGTAWNRAIKDAKANGNNVIMANGSNASRAAYLKALGTPDAQVVFVGHSVDDATGKAGSLLLTGNQAVGKLSPFVNPDGTGGTVPSVATPGNIDAQSVGAFACTSDTLSGQYSSTDFSGLSGLVFDRTADAGAAAYTDVLAKDGSTADADSAAQKAMDRTQTTINPSDGKPAGPAPKVKDHPND